MMTAAQAEHYNPIVGYRDFGLMPGDLIEITKGSGAIAREPDWVAVAYETPLFIVVNYFFRHWDGRVLSYPHCLNKHLIAIGDIVFHKVEYYEEHDL